jgi:RHS repeat-associated protein
MTVSSLDYEPYGQATGAVETAYPFSFTGRVPVTAGVSHFRGRFYDSSSDRFLSEDWSRLAIDLNLYRYVRGSPVNFRDPSGRNVVAVALLIIYLLEEYARDRALEQEAEQTGDTNGYQTGGATMQNETMGPPNEQNQPLAGSDSGQPAGNEQQPDCEFGNPRIWERLQWLSRFFRM